MPGDHDSDLIAPWLRANGVPPAVAGTVPRDATPLLAEVVASLGPADVHVRYPGVWLDDRVWATHGHYLDRHLLPEAAFGIARGLLGRLPRDGARPVDYERAGGPSLTRLEGRLTRWLPRPLAALVDDLAELLRAATMPLDKRSLLTRRLSPFTVGVLGAQMRRASIPALGRVVHRLGVDADWVLFGHVHRGGPLAGDDPLDWVGPGGRPTSPTAAAGSTSRCSCTTRPLPHPYWPGGAIVLEDGSDPRTVGLLDHLDASALH